MCTPEYTHIYTCVCTCKCTPAKNVESFSRKCGLNLHNPFPKFTVLSIKLLLLETSIKPLNVCSTKSTLGKELGESILLAQLIHAKQWTRGAVSHQPEGLSLGTCPPIYVEARYVFIGAPIPPGKQFLCVASLLVSTAVPLRTQLQLSYNLQSRTYVSVWAVVMMAFWREWNWTNFELFNCIE